MTDVRLTDKQWAKIRDFLRQDPNTYIGKDEQACRRFVEAVKWISRSGAQWRLLPDEYGNWNSIYKRFMRGARLVFGNECWLVLPMTQIWRMG
jgi:transposase